MGFHPLSSLQENTRGGDMVGRFLPLLHPHVSILDGGDGHGRQTLLQPGLFMGKGCFQGRGEEFGGYIPSCLHNACLRSLPFSPVLSWPIPPLSLSQQGDVCILPCPSLLPQS